jgi:hypothetical protein
VGRGRRRLEGVAGLDPYLNDPDHWGVSMAQLRELIVGCLDAAGARSVAEVGAFAGDLTRLLAEWAAGSGARVQAIDPAPQDSLVRLADEYPQLELIRQTSLEALPTLELPDAIVIDGDHNYFTVSRELALIAERAAQRSMPLLMFHDVAWPHARRDDYFAPEALPEDDRQPLVGEGHGISPGNAGVDPRGLPYPKSAASEGGARNGVLTAIEDFVAEHPRLRLAVVPAFFGFGALWALDAPFAAELAKILDPLDRHPVLERLEFNRVRLLADRQECRTEVWELRQQLARQEDLLRRLLESRAFAVADRLSQLRVKAGVARDAAPISKDELREVLGEP